PSLLVPVVCSGLRLKVTIGQSGVKMSVANGKCRFPLPYLRLTTDDLKGSIRFGRPWGTRGDSLVGDAQEFYGRAAQSRPSRKRKTRNELEEPREENKQLREIVAHLSELVLTQIAGAAEPKEQSASAED